MEQLKVRLPLPPKTLHPNSRPHYRTKAKDTSGYRDMAGIMARAAMGRHPAPRWAQAVEHATFYFKDKRQRDKDNCLAWLKSAFDGITDAGVLDDDVGLWHAPVTLCIDKSDPRVEIVVRPGVVQWTVQSDVA